MSFFSHHDNRTFRGISSALLVASVVPIVAGSSVEAADETTETRTESRTVEREVVDREVTVKERRVAGAIFVDVNRNGVLDAKELVASTDPRFPREKIAVRAVDAAGVAVECVAPENSFQCDLSELTGEQVRLEFKLGDADRAAGFSSTVRGVSSASAVQFVAVGSTANFGVVPPAECEESCELPIEIGDRLWFDADRDGVQDPGEAPLANVSVTLNGKRGVVAQRGTDEFGNFVFRTADGLQPETAYTLSFDLRKVTGLPEGVAIADLKATTPNAGDSEAIGSKLVGTEIAFVSPAAGINLHSLDAGFATDAPLVLGNSLWADVNSDGKFGEGEAAVPAGVLVDLLDSKDAVVASVETNAKGAYRFDKVAAGEYRVSVAASNFAAGGLLEGQIPRTGAKATLSADGSIKSALVAVSADGDVAADGTLSVSPAFGLIAGAKISTVALEDIDGSRDKSAADRALVGLTVNLLDGAGERLATTKTGADGAASFDRLAPGSYSLEFVAPEGRTLVASAGSKVVVVDGRQVLRTAAIEVAVGEKSQAGTAFIAAAALSIGGKLWLDADNDASFDDGEEGAPGGVTVDLIDGAGAIVATTTTDNTGTYRFDGLEAGAYRVSIAASNFSTGALLDGRIPSTSAAAELRSDGAIVSKLITLSNGDELSSDGTHTSSPAFGLIAGASISTVVFEDVDGDRAKSTGDQAFNGVEVKLLNQDEVVVARLATNGDGVAEFERLAAGEYHLDVVAPVGRTLVAPADGTSSIEDGRQVVRTAMLEVGVGEQVVTNGVTVAPALLPSTGAVTLNGMLLAGFSSLLVGLALLGSTRRRRLAVIHM